MATTSTAKSENIGVAMLERLAEVDARTISPEIARTFLQIGFDCSHQERVSVLSEKARRGSLTTTEGQELDEFIHMGNLLAILQSKARQALKQAGPQS